MTAQILSFTEWPPPARTDASAPIVVGVFGDADRFAVFEALFRDPLYQGQFAARLVRADDGNDAFSALDALVFTSAAPPREVARAIKRLEGQPVALVGSFDGFLELGGMVNLTKKQKRLGFAIDLAQSRARGITYRAKLLRLASQIIGE